MKKKIMIGLLIITPFIFLGWLYSVGYIPVVGNMIATENLNDYATEVYGTEEKINVGYDFYNMGNYTTDGYAYILNSNRIIDYNLYENSGEQTPHKQDYQKIVDTFEEGIHFEDYSISCTIDADDYSKKYYQLVVYKMSNDNRISAAESATKPAEIVMHFIDSMETKYNFTSVQITYTDNNGTKQISFSGNSTVTEDLLIEHTKTVA